MQDFNLCHALDGGKTSSHSLGSTAPAPLGEAQTHCAAAELSVRPLHAGLNCLHAMCCVLRHSVGMHSATCPIRCIPSIAMPAYSAAADSNHQLLCMTLLLVRLGTQLQCSAPLHVCPCVPGNYHPRMQSEDTHPPLMDPHCIPDCKRCATSCCHPAPEPSLSCQNHQALDARAWCADRGAPLQPHHPHRGCLAHGRRRTRPADC